MLHSVLLDCLPRYGCDWNGLALVVTLLSGFSLEDEVDMCAAYLVLHIVHPSLGLAFGFALTAHPAQATEASAGVAGWGTPNA